MIYFINKAFEGLILFKIWFYFILILLLINQGYKKIDEIFLINAGFILVTIVNKKLIFNYQKKIINS